MSLDGGEPSVRPRAERKEINKFCCPFCGSTEYSQVNVVTCLVPAMSFAIPDVLYKCNGCSIIFADPEKFMKINKKRC